MARLLRIRTPSNRGTIVSGPSTPSRTFSGEAFAPDQGIEIGLSASPAERARREMRQKAEPDPVNHPSHYKHPSGIECIDVVEHLPFLRGNAIKYLWRAGEKGGRVQQIEDLRKAKWYIEREIANLLERGPR